MAKGDKWRFGYAWNPLLGLSLWKWGDKPEKSKRKAMKRLRKDFPDKEWKAKKSGSLHWIEYRWK